MKEAAKHPLLIPKNSQLSKLIVRAVTERFFHLKGKGKNEPLRKFAISQPIKSGKKILFGFWQLR
jgi:hypothetical protein